MAEAAISRPWTVSRVAKYLAVTIGSLLLVLVLLVAAFYWWMSGGVFTISRFDPEAWYAPQTNITDSTCYRGGMAADIRDRLLKPGMTHQDVERLLGKPDGHTTPAEYQYILGMCSGFMMDYDNLHIYFDRSGRYERAAIIQH